LSKPVEVGCLTRVLLLTSRFDEIAGGWTFFKEIASRLSRNGHEVTVISPRLLGSKPFERQGRIQILRIRSLYVPAIPLVLPSLFSLSSALKKTLAHTPIEVVYDTTFLVHPLSILAVVLLSAMRPDIPVLAHACGELRDIGRGKLARALFGVYLRLTAHTVLRRARYALVAGDAVYSMASNLGVPRHKISIVRLGPMHEITRVRNESAINTRKRIRESLGLQRDDVAVGVIGRLQYGKRVDLVLHAIEELQRTERRLRLLVIGAGPEEPRLRKLDRELACDAKFLGWRQDIPDLLLALDLYVSASESEAGMSSSLLEAMNAGLACIVTPFTRAIINRKNGLVVPFNSPNALEDAIKSLCQSPNLRRTLGTAARQTAHSIAKKHSWDVFVDRIDAVFRRVTQDGSA
jgi:glycosyltransferase involved in cell wall biosynthesis